MLLNIPSKKAISITDTQIYIIKSLLLDLLDEARCYFPSFPFTDSALVSILVSGPV